MKNKKTIFHPIKLIGALVFLMAFTLNVQTSLNGEWELVNVGFAQDGSGGSEGSGGSSGGSGGCTNGSVGDDAYLLCDYKKQFLSTNCKKKEDYTCLLRDTHPGWPELPDLP